MKSLVFGIACSLVAVYEGYNAEPTAAGVGLATTRTVVASSVLMLLLDYVLTAPVPVEGNLSLCAPIEPLRSEPDCSCCWASRRCSFLTTQLPSSGLKVGSAKKAYG